MMSVPVLAFRHVVQQGCRPHDRQVCALGLADADRQVEHAQDVIKIVPASAPFIKTASRLYTDGRLALAFMPHVLLPIYARSAVRRGLPPSVVCHVASVAFRAARRTHPAGCPGCCLPASAET